MLGWPDGASDAVNSVDCSRVGPSADRISCGSGHDHHQLFADPRAGAAAQGRPRSARRPDAGSSGERSQARGLADAKALSLLSKGVFRAGFNWKVVEKRWPDIEAALHGFDPERIDWHKETGRPYAELSRIVVYSVPE